MPMDERGAAYLDAARQRVVIFDGAMGTSLQLADLSADDYGGPALEGCSEAVVLTRPDVVSGIHRSFLDAGVDVVETNAFGAFSVVLAEYDLQDRVEEINLTAARLARVSGSRRPERPARGPRECPHRPGQPTCAWKRRWPPAG